MSYHRPRAPRKPRARHYRVEPVSFRNECGKVAYETRAQAKDHARSLKQSGEVGVRPYACPDCGFFHVGHMPLVVARGAMSAQEYYA